MPIGIFRTLKKARRLTVKPVVSELKATKSGFSPAAFHKDLKNNKYLVSYDPYSLFSYGFINPKGSTLSLGLVFRTILMCGVGTIAAIFSCEADQSYSFCFPVMIFNEGLIFASLVAFLLGLFISTTFSRWWSIRDKLATIMCSTTSLSIMLNSFAPTDEETVEITRRMIRLMHLAHALIYKQANDDTDLNDLIESKLARQEEVDALLEYEYLNHPAIVYSWVMALLKSIQPKMPAPTCVPSITCINQSIQAAHMIHALVKTQMPYVYLHLLAMTTKIHLALVVFYSGGVIAEGMDKRLWTRIFFGYTIIITNNTIYEGLLKIHAMLYNPLGDEHADFPTNLYLTKNIALAALNATMPKHLTETSTSDLSSSARATQAACVDVDDGADADAGDDGDADFDPGNAEAVDVAVDVGE